MIGDNMKNNDDDDKTDNNDTDTDDDVGVYYFNNAGQAQLSLEVQQMGIKIISQTPPWDDNNHKYAQSSQKRIRTLFSTLIGDNNNDNDINESSSSSSSGSRIAIVPSTAFAITLAARNIQRLHYLQQRDSNGDSDGDGNGRIIVLQDQYDSAVYPWQQICDESDGKISLDIVEYPSSSSSSELRTADDYEGSSGWTKAVLEKLLHNKNDDNNNNKILAACLPPLHWSDGTLLDLEIIGKVCKQQDIPLIIDATQVIGIMSFNIQNMGQPCMVACSTHKWLRGPSGCSLVYVSPDVQNTWIPLDYHGRGRAFLNTTHKNEMRPKQGYPEQYYNDSRKFDSGGKANPILLPMLQVAMESVVQLGDLVQVQLQLKTLMEPLLNWAIQNNYTINKVDNNQDNNTDDEDYDQYHAYHIIGLIPKEKTPEEMIIMVQKLAKERKIFLAVRCGGIRVSPYITTTQNDVQKLIEGLKEFS
jgi:selenocysteine lyase/cysteine desulfurase